MKNGVPGGKVYSDVDKQKAHTSSKAVWEGLAFFLIPLVSYILGNKFVAAFTHSANKIRTTPEVGFPIERSKVFGEFFSE